jgi:hypothetical protein
MSEDRSAKSFGSTTSTKSPAPGDAATHSKDVSLSTPPSSPTALPRECVGSLLIPAHDLQELSCHTSPPLSPGSKIMRRITEELNKPVDQEVMEEMEEAYSTWSG